MLVIQCPDLISFHGGTEKARGFSRQRQPRFFYGGNAFIPPPAPIDHGILFLVLPILHIVDDGVVPPLLLARVKTNKLYDTFIMLPCRKAARIVVAILFLGSNFVLQRTFFMTVCNRGQETGPQAFLFQCQSVSVPVNIPLPMCLNGAMRPWRGAI